MEKLDLLDKKILYELDCNGRATYSQIAKKVRTSKATVKYRVERLIEKKIIIGFHAVIDSALLGYLVCRLNIRLKNCPPDIEKNIINYLMEDNKVYVLFKVNGPYHIVLGIKARNAWTLRDFWDKFNNKFFQYIHSSSLSIILDYTEFSRSYLLPKQTEKKQFITLKSPGTYKIDETDQKLLDYLLKKGRSQLVDIAKHLGKSTMVVRHRMKTLEKNKIIVGYRALLNHEKLGYYYYKVDCFLSSKKNFKKLRTFVLSHPNIVYTEKSLITADFEFDLEVEDFMEFTRIMESFKSKFPEDILDYNYYSLVKGYKLF